MDLRSDDVVGKMFQIARSFDETAYTKPWDGKKQRLIAFMYYGHEKDPGMEFRAEITSSSKAIYWWIGIHSPFYMKYASKIDKFEDSSWRSKYKVETRIVFNSVEEFVAFTDDCLENIDDINMQREPKGMSADGFVVICPRCETKFKRADRCPECGQLIKYDKEL